MANIILNFIKKIKNKNKEISRPRFNQEDYIYNKKFKTFAKVIRVYWREDRPLEDARYTIKYLKNPKAVELGIGLEHNRSKKVKAIDAYYELADPKVVALLFKTKEEIK